MSEPVGGDRVANILAAIAAANVESHGPWLKDQQRYADGCKPGDLPHAPEADG